MERSITGFELDDVGDWTALLDCGHRQHVRHKPPFMNRPWVTTAEGREGMLGRVLNCVRCDRLEMPEGVVADRATPTFTAETIPAGLLKNHTTKAGCWAEIVVEEGSLRYRVDSLGIDMELAPTRHGVIPPGVPHHVEAIGPVRFHVAFYRLADPSMDVQE